MSEIVASFGFECGSPEAASRIAKLINRSEPYPAELWQKICELGFGGLELDASAYVERNHVWIEIYEVVQFARVVGAILDFAMRAMPEIPSPQGFIYGDDEFYGGAVVIKRGVGWKDMYNSAWLDEQLGLDEPVSEEGATLADFLEKT